MPVYLEHGLLRRNPFDTIDVDGVGDLVAIAVERGRRTNRHLKLGVCGEHGGDPASIAFFQRVGLDYVSCSPFRVPVARLAAAQAIVGARLTAAISTVREPRAGRYTPPDRRGVALNVTHRQYGQRADASIPSARWVRPRWRARPSAGSPR